MYSYFILNVLCRYPSTLLCPEYTSQVPMSLVLGTRASTHLCPCPPPHAVPSTYSGPLPHPATHFQDPHLKFRHSAGGLATVVGAAEARGFRDWRIRRPAISMAPLAEGASARHARGRRLGLDGKGCVRRCRGGGRTGFYWVRSVRIIRTGGYWRILAGLT